MLEHRDKSVTCVNCKKKINFMWEVTEEQAKKRLNSTGWRKTSYGILCASCVQMFQFVKGETEEIT